MGRVYLCSKYYEFPIVITLESLHAKSLLSYGTLFVLGRLARFMTEKAVAARA